MCQAPIHVPGPHPCARPPSMCQAPITHAPPQSAGEAPCPQQRCPQQHCYPQARLVPPQAPPAAPHAPTPCRLAAGRAQAARLRGLRAHMSAVPLTRRAPADVQCVPKRTCSMVKWQILHLHTMTCVHGHEPSAELSSAQRLVGAGRRHVAQQLQSGGILVAGCLAACHPGPLT
jgi:hypothetical protein